MDRNISVGMKSEDVRKSGNLDVVRDCAGFIAINKGDVPCRVNGVPLLPAVDPTTQSGESFGLDMNAGEEYTGSIGITFESSTGNPFVVVAQKFYNT